MSAGAGVWKPAVVGAQAEPRRKHPRSGEPVDLSAAATGPISSLARQLFFPNAAAPRKRILFVAADAQTKVSQICEQLAFAVSQMSTGMAAVVEATAEPSVELRGKKPRNHSGSELWRRHSSEVKENVWRVPPTLFCAGHPGCDPEDATSDDIRELHETFDHVLFGASIHDSYIPVFANICGSAVLVLGANHTRREAALQAKERLLRNNVELLGTILIDRVLPIPERIYRRL